MDPAMGTGVVVDSDLVATVINLSQDVHDLSTVVRHWYNGGQTEGTYEIDWRKLTTSLGEHASNAADAATRRAEEEWLARKKSEIEEADVPLVLVSSLDQSPDAETLTDKSSKDAKPDYVIGRARGHKKHPSLIEPDPSRLNTSGNYLTSESLTTLRSQGLDPAPSGTSRPRFASTNYFLKDVVSAYEELQNLEFFLHSVQRIKANEISGQASHQAHPDSDYTYHGLSPQAHVEDLTQAVTGIKSTFDAIISRDLLNVGANIFIE